MKHIMTIEKPKNEKYESKIKKATKYSYSTIIPKEVIEIFPQLKEDAKLVYDIKQIGTNQYEYDITFQAKGITNTDKPKEEKVKKESMTIDKPPRKTTIKKPATNTKRSDAGDKLDVNLFKDISLMDGKYTIKVNSPSRPKMRIVGKAIRDEIDKTEIVLSVGNKSEEEVKAIIDELISCKNPSAKELNDILNSYKSEQYQT